MKRFAAIFLVFASAFAEEPPPPRPVLRELAPGVFEIGKMRLDQNARTLTFPGKVNMRLGLLEYLLVTPQGSKHESLLVSDVAPSDVHLAMLLLGAKGGDYTGPAVSGPIDGEFLRNASKLKGDAIQISVQWKDGSADKTAPVEDWLFDLLAKKPIEHGPWTYNGSMFIEGHFLAQMDGAFAALVTNPSALINNPRKGSDNGEMWGVNENTVPPVDTPVAIIFKLIPPAKQEPKP